jgi:hypothetical protein
MAIARPNQVIFARGLALLLMAALLGGCSFLEERRHRAELDRIAKHLNDKIPGVDVGQQFASDMFASKEGIWPKPDEARAILIRALGMSLHNEFWSSSRCDRAKLRAVLARLDADGGADLNTVEGCLRIFTLMLEVTPTARDYGPFTYILAAQSMDTFPKPGGPLTRMP